MINLPSQLTPSELLYCDKLHSPIKGWLQTSRSLRKEGRLLEAERCALNAQDACKTGARIGLALAKLHLSDFYCEVGELGRAIEQCKQAYGILRGQPARIQRHNQAVAAYALGILHERQLFGDDKQALYWYQEALQQFEKAQEYWLEHKNISQFETCQRACLWIEERKKQIAYAQTDEQIKLTTLDIYQLHSTDVPFSRDSRLHGYITSDNHVLVNGTTYRLHSGTIPDISTNGAHYYFALPVPKKHWAVSDAQVGDYVLVRQQWRVEKERLGVVWEPGSGWCEVNFKCDNDGKMRFHHPHPQIIGDITPPGDPRGKVKGYIIALLKPLRKTFDFAGVVIEGLGADSTLTLNKEYKLRAGFPKDDFDGLASEPVHPSGTDPMKIDVTVYAPGIDILPDWIQNLDILPGQEPTPLEFTLIPRKEGKAQIEINFYSQRRLLAEFRFPIKIRAFSQNDTNSGMQQL